MTKTALIVDDSKTMRNMVSMALQEMGFQVDAAGDGDEAANMVLKRQYDIIITDINMPNMDGIELIRYIRSESICKDIPILVLTTEAGDNAKQKGKEAGASGWMVKPFRPEVMKAAVKKVCAL